MGAPAPRMVADTPVSPDDVGGPSWVATRDRLWRYRHGARDRRRIGVRLVAKKTEESADVIGLEDRLRTVDGVASIRVELGDEGVDAIQVEVQPDADEAGVLEEIRQVLVAYGLRSRRPGWKLGSRKSSPAIVASIADDPTIELPTDTEAAPSLPDLGSAVESGDDAEQIPEERTARERSAGVEVADDIDFAGLPRVKVLQGGKGLIISVSGEGRSAEASSDISPIGAAEAMAKVVADFHGMDRPDRVAVVMHELDGERVVTLLMRRGDRSAVAVEVAAPMLHDALYRATVRTLTQLSESVPI